MLAIGALATLNVNGRPSLSAYGWRRTALSTLFTFLTPLTSGTGKFHFQIGRIDDDLISSLFGMMATMP